MKNIMEEVRKFLRTYPPLAEGKLHVDFLPEEAQSYSVEAVPAKEIVRSYVDGSTVRQFLFVVASREFLGIKSDSSWITSAFTVISPNGCGNRLWQAAFPIWARAERSC